MLTATRFSGTQPEHDGALHFYQNVLQELTDAGVPFMVGGGFAFTPYTGIERPTKDLDLFVRPQDAEWTVGTIEQAGYNAAMVTPHWLAKAWSADGAFIDIVFSSGNGVAVVDDQWLEFAEWRDVLGLPVRLSPVEEMIWSKAFVLERERYDGADIAHLIRARGPELDWERLFRRFDDHWQVLLSHLVLVSFVYPSHRDLIPRWVMKALMGRMQLELESGNAARPLCKGTLLSDKQFLVDVEDWGYQDARLEPDVQMSAHDIVLLNEHLEAEDRAKGIEPSRRR